MAVSQGLQPRAEYVSLQRPCVDILMTVECCPPHGGTMYYVEGIPVSVAGAHQFTGGVQSE